MNAPLALASQIGLRSPIRYGRNITPWPSSPHLARRILQQLVRIAACRRAASDLGLAELLAIPRDRRAGRDGAAEHVIVLQAVEHVRHADQAVARVDGLADVAPAHAGADHRDVLALPGRARGEGGDGRIDAARDDRRAGLQAELRRPLRQQPAHHLARFDQALRHHRRRNAERVEHLPRPGAAADVVDAADIAGGGVVDRELARQHLGDVGVRRQEIARPAPHLRLVLAQPQHLGVAVVAIDAVAGDIIEPVEVDGAGAPIRLRRWRADPSRSGRDGAAASRCPPECPSRRTGCSRTSP